MQIHEMLRALMAAGNPEETAREIIVYALQARRVGGWRYFEAKPEAALTKAEASRILEEAEVDPDDVEMPNWYGGFS